MGTGDLPPLPKDALPPGGNSDRFEGRRGHHREVGQEQAEAPHHGDWREAGQGAQSGQIRRMQCPNAGSFINSSNKRVTVHVQSR